MGLGVKVPKIEIILMKKHIPVGRALLMSL